ncbi:MAG: copper chaperone PCu(A)C [Halomonas sp.]|nr:copper chaperone PCu(A)C [Halomonas sp.]TVP47959.1 MAG: copper chaperone PCu(A)C [Halomonas sp.]
MPIRHAAYLKSGLTAALMTLALMSTPLWAAHHGDGHDEAVSEQTANIDVSQPWARATPPGAASGGGFVTLTNLGDTDDRLIDVSTTITERSEIHTMEVDGDVMRMEHLPEGLKIPAGETVTLAPGGLHLMFMGLASPIEEGGSIPVTLTFEQAGSIEIELEVVPVGASPEGVEDHSDHHADHHHSHDQHDEENGHAHH